jgi:hypothetical protein
MIYKGNSEGDFLYKKRCAVLAGLSRGMKLAGYKERLFNDRLGGV